VNGSTNQIEIFKPFGEAFELTKKILFRPFDLKKWFVIGFAAWLSNLGSGNYSFRFNRSDWKNVSWFQDLDDMITQIPHWILWSGLGVIILLVFALMIVIAWLRARGRFMFIDCIVKNRGAIAEPWREFRNQGNSYFLFGLLVGFIILIILAAASLPFMLPIVRWCDVPAYARRLPDLHDRSLGSRFASPHFGVGAHLAFHDRSDVSPPLSRGRGVSDCAFLDRQVPGRDHTLLFVLDCSGNRNGNYRLRDNSGDLLYRATSVHRDGHLAAVVCLSARVWAPFYPTIRTRLRCVGRNP
jgi:hypothetical protein